MKKVSYQILCSQKVGIWCLLEIGVVMCFCSIFKHEIEIIDIPIHKSEEVMKAFCSRDLLANVQGRGLLSACITFVPNSMQEL